MIKQRILSENERDMAKKNTFILIGITGKGKSQIIKYLTGDPRAVVSDGYESCTPYSSMFYGSIKKDANKEEFFCMIDTAGLCDSEGSAKDREHYNDIRNILIKNKCEIKGIFIVENFQDERIDGEERKVIKAASDLFPLKQFWEHVTFVFTHYYDKGYKKKEKIRDSKEKQFANNIKKIMNEVSERIKSIDIIDDKKISKLYINIDDDVIENRIDQDEKEMALKELGEVKLLLYKEMINKINIEPLYDEVRDAGKQKLIIKKDETSFRYNIYETFVEKREFYLKGKKIFVDFIQCSEPKLKENINKIAYRLEQFGKGFVIVNMAIFSPIYKGVDVIINGDDATFEIGPALSLLIDEWFPDVSEEEYRIKLYQ